MNDFKSEISSTFQKIIPITWPLSFFHLSYKYLISNGGISPLKN